MIKFGVTPESVQEVEDYFKLSQEKILEGIRGGMRLAMEGLATVTAEHAPWKQGDLALAIAQSPKVRETPLVIRGSVSTDVGGKHVGLWLEHGIKVPAVPDFIAFDVGSDEVFSYGHKAFDVPAHPFVNQALESYKATVLETITREVAEAVS
jgi:hypothetical protein